MYRLRSGFQRALPWEPDNGVYCCAWHGKVSDALRERSIRRCSQMFGPRAAREAKRRALKSPAHLTDDLMRATHVTASREGKISDGANAN